MLEVEPIVHCSPEMTGTATKPSPIQKHSLGGANCEAGAVQRRRLGHAAAISDKRCVGCGLAEFAVVKLCEIPLIRLTCCLCSHSTTAVTHDQCIAVKPVTRPTVYMSDKFTSRPMSLSVFRFQHGMHVVQSSIIRRRKNVSKRVLKLLLLLKVIL